MPSEVRLKNCPQEFGQFVWMSFQNPLAHTHFNMFVDE